VTKKGPDAVQMAVEVRARESLRITHARCVEHFKRRMSNSVDKLASAQEHLDRTRAQLEEFKDQFDHHTAALAAVKPD